ncbi:MAG TPA: thiamine diphosphokinase [Symbiobacteriaceae bacterium]|nr:thiamine diphosphokinase [Symbiobacteriaceae bacterium]
MIFGAGAVAEWGRIRALLGTPDLVICADGGVRHALALGLTPDLVLGDFDSAGPAVVAEIAARGIPVHKVPTEKDETDAELAIQEALKLGATAITLVGVTGGRLDHTVANLLLLPGIPGKVEVRVLDTSAVLWLLRPGGRITVPAQPGAYLSLLPLSPEVRGVVAEGVQWPLAGETLRWGQTRGVSNRISADEAFIAVRDGYLLVIQAWE